MERNKVTSSIVRVFKKTTLSFPFRFMACAIFFSAVFLGNLSAIQNLEDQTLVTAFNTLSIPSFNDANLYIGSQYFPITVSVPIHVQLLFIVFFASLAVSTSGSLSLRIRIVFFLALAVVLFPLSEVILVAGLYWLHMALFEAYLYGSYIVASITGAFLLETCLFKNITWPKGNMVRPIVKRTYLDEYLFFVAMLATSSILMYMIASLLQMDSSSLAFSYLVLNISVIFSFNNFLAFFFIEARMPTWLKQRAYAQSGYHPPVSFLLPAYNEEANIGRCIESIDEAAAAYEGSTEIIVVNDGSTDNTRKIASECVLRLKNCSGKVLNIPNSGKGTALRYGLERLSGEIVFRIDTDSIIDARAIKPVVEHFRDPYVGSVSGAIVPMEERSFWQKIIFLDFLFMYLFYKREEEVLDAIMVQSGAFSVFRKNALLRVGGWVENRFGEDGEITIRLARHGYKNDIEPRAIVLTDQPGNWKALREQRIRWNIGYYYSRSANFNILKEFPGPRTLVYMFSIYAHGIDFAYAISLPFFVLGLFFEYYNYSVPRSVLFDDIFRIMLIDLLLFGMQHIFHVYCAYKFKRKDLLAYIPLLRLYSIINQVIFRTEAMEILLTWSSSWKTYNAQAFIALKRVMRKTLEA